MANKVTIVTRKTRLEQLVERHSLLTQAQFIIESAGGDFSTYEREDKTYRLALATVRKKLPVDTFIREIEREQLRTTQFRDGETIIAVGDPGLLANTAKYVGGQNVISINANPDVNSDIFTSCTLEEFSATYQATVHAQIRPTEITLVEAELNDGRTLRALNDIYVGTADRSSAQYLIEHYGCSEQQSSDGVLIYTGAGSTAWASALIGNAYKLGLQLGFVDRKAMPPESNFHQEEHHVKFIVNGAYKKPATQTDLITGKLPPGRTITITSLMPEKGVIFGDGMQSDYLQFEAGQIAQIGPSDQKLNLIQTL